MTKVKSGIIATIDKGLKYHEWEGNSCLLNSVMIQLARWGCRSMGNYDDKDGVSG